MAKVTGFTADRMLVIENETVVDGEVQGDNLVLMTREGTPINAGNVRGPQGAQGIPGPVSSVNDQTGIAYAPRIFPSMTSLTGTWPNAPVGAMAVTTDNDAVWEKTVNGWTLANNFHIFATVADLNSRWGNAPEGARAVTIDNDVSWYKHTQGWQIDNGIRIYATLAERDARWPTPPNGALCMTIEGDTLWQRVAGAWIRNKPWNQPWGMLNQIYMAADSGNFGSNAAAIPGMTLGAQILAGRMYHLHASVFIINDGSTTHEKAWLTNDVYGNSIITQSFQYMPGGVYMMHHMDRIWNGPTPGWHTFQLFCQTDIGLSHVHGGAESTSMYLQDVGPAM